MDLATVVVLSLVLGVSLSGTAVILVWLRREVSHLRKINSELLSRYEELRELLLSREDRLPELEDRLHTIEKVVAALSKGAQSREGTRQQPKPKQVQRTPALELKVLALRQQGLSIRQIARALGISKSTVHRILKEAEEADLFTNARLPNEVEA